ncbi:MAG: S8 family serine peptidase [Cyclobacteriaceae bacterium]
MLKSKLLVLFLLVMNLVTKAEVNRYMVFFSDKDTTSFSTSNPAEFLSERAIQRRAKQGVVITAQDFPVNKDYVISVSNAGADVYFRSKWFNAVLVQMDESLVDAVKLLDHVAKVEYIAKGALLSRNIEEVQIPEEFLEPPTITSSSDKQLRMIGADKMHDDGYSGEGMMIAVFDNGFSGVNEFKPFEHVFDNERLIASYDFIENTGNVFQHGSHGTQVFSCIAAKYEDNLLGTAPDASFVLCVTEETFHENRVEEYNWLFAAEFADSIGVDVINNSLGYSDFDEASMSYSREDLDGETTVITQAANIASSKGILVTTSAGNEGGNSWSKITAPADSKDVMAVGSVTSERIRSSFSSFGPTEDGRVKPDVVALGSRASVMKSNGSISVNSGTSFSSPIMAGFAACVWQKNPEWNNQEVIEAIRSSGSNATSPDTLIGYGIPSYSFIATNGVLSVNDLINTELKVFPNPFTENKVTIDFQGIVIDQPLSIEILDNQGKSVYTRRVTRKNTPDKIEVEFEAKSTGVYFLSIKSRKIQKTIKLIKI